MTRSSFIQSLFALGAGAMIPVTWHKQYQKYYLLQCFVAGFRFHKGVKLLPLFKEHDILTLIREPQNKYDKQAIALHWKINMIGYVPAVTNKILSRLLDAEALPLHAEILHIEPNAKEWENVHVGIYFLKESNVNVLPQAQYLTLVEEPEYYTLKNNYENITRIERYHQPELLVVHISQLDKIDTKLRHKIIEENSSPAIAPKLFTIDKTDKGGIELNFGHLQEELTNFANNIDANVEHFHNTADGITKDISNIFSSGNYRILADKDVEKLLPFVKELKEIKDSYQNIFTELIM